MTRTKKVKSKTRALVNANLFKLVLKFKESVYNMKSLGYKGSSEET